MQYMLLLFEEETVMKRAIEGAGFEAYMSQWETYTDELEKAGVMAGGNPLSEAKTATTLSVRNGERKIQDGPFIDTKEQLGGYYIIDVKSLDEAIHWAEKCPLAPTGFVEIRPIADMTAP